MDSRSATAHPQHHNYPTTPWISPSLSATVVKPTTSTRSDATIAIDPSALSFPNFKFLPFYFPQQSSVYQAQLLQYNRLISSHVQAVPLPRSSIKVSLKDIASSVAAAPATAIPVAAAAVASGGQSGSQGGGHGSRVANHHADKGTRAVITVQDAPTNMAASKPESASRPLPHPSVPTYIQASNSVPSTPHQHARDFPFESRDPSPNATNDHSPRSAYSETNGTTPSLRPLPPRLGGCQFETAQAGIKRRIPYTIGNERLEKIDPGTLKNKLDEGEERGLTAGIKDLYEKLLPTPKVERNRQKLIEKLERIFNDEWPGHDIRAHLFGSSGSLLCSDDSDVDICITTTWTSMGTVCIIADLLEKRGMEKVVCIAAAKVPIVKMWDPELQLACDMNVNNTLALENTRMVRTYVEIDPRVRPLAMIVKYWTRRRVINDAAFGYTLSSYTWLCMIIAFLQLRHPAILPALHQCDAEKLKKPDGEISDFADDLDKLKGFGVKNKASLGDLMFQFFRFYAHEFDYDNHVLSIRMGKLLTKTQKKWLYSINNQLCVEEPFNTNRNLANTADEFSFRGLHLEIRRAFDLISEAKLDECLEQWEWPKEEERIFVRPAQVPRPALIRSSSQQTGSRGGRNGFRGGRNGNGYRGGGSNRGRTSSAANQPAYENGPIVYTTQQIIAAQPQDWYQTGHALQYVHQDLMTAYALQQQESLRALQMFNQPYIQAQIQAQQQQQQQQHHNSQPASQQQQQQQQQPGQQPGQQTQKGQHRIAVGSAPQGQQAQQLQQQPQQPQQPTDRPRTNSLDSPPLSAPLRPDFYAMYGMPMAAYYGYPTMMPVPTPAVSSNVGEYRRSTRASGEAGLSAQGSSLRSQSQPASRTPAQNGTSQTPHGGHTSNATPQFPHRNVNGVNLPSFIHDDADAQETQHMRVQDSPPEEAAPEYHFSDHSSPGGRPQTGPEAIAFGDVGQSSQGRRRRLSTDQFPQALLDRRMKRTSRSPSPISHGRAFSVGTSPMQTSSSSSNGTLTPTRARASGRSLAANGAVKPTASPSSRQHPVVESLIAEDTNLAGYDNPLKILGGNGYAGYVAEHFAPQPAVASSDLVVKPIHERPPVVVNGTNTPPTAMLHGEDSSFRARMQHYTLAQNMPPPHREPTAKERHSPRQNMMARQQPAGTMYDDYSPGDLAITSADQRSLSVQDLHGLGLSPVMEHRTPSPLTASKTDRRGKEPVVVSSLNAKEQCSPKQENTSRAGNMPAQPLVASGLWGNPAGWHKATNNNKRGKSANSEPKQTMQRDERKGG